MASWCTGLCMTPCQGVGAGSFPAEVAKVKDDRLGLSIIVLDNTEFLPL